MKRPAQQHLDWGCQAASDDGTSCHDGRMAPSLRARWGQKCAPRPVPNDMCPSNHWTRRILLLAAMAMLVMVTLFNSNLQQSLLMKRLPEFLKANGKWQRITVRPDLWSRHVARQGVLEIPRLSARDGSTHCHKSACEELSLHHRW